MRLSVHFSPGRARVKFLTAVALLPLLALGQPRPGQPGPGQPRLARDGDRWVRVYSGSEPAGQRLRVNAHGPVTFQGGTASRLQYTVRVSVTARTEAQPGVERGGSSRRATESPAARVPIHLPLREGSKWMERVRTRT